MMECAVLRAILRPATLDALGVFRFGEVEAIEEVFEVRAGFPGGATGFGCTWMILRVLVGGGGRWKSSFGSGFFAPDAVRL
jgi:hypothetical protein